MTAIAVSLATLVMTLLGGLFALRFKDRLHLILGFSGGAVLSVAFFDLLPEALGLAGPKLGVSLILAIVMTGFIAYMVLDRAAGAQPANEQTEARPWQRGALGAAILCIHSFFDGFVIGLGFKASLSVGIVVSAAVLAHDFSDGINTVGVILGKRGGNRSALRWLLLDAVAPMFGAASTVAVHFRVEMLGGMLALCSGFFIYMSASDLVPESYHNHPRGLTTLMTVLGVLSLCLVANLFRS